jgi:hypothetical protein
LLYLFILADGCDLVYNTIGISILFDVCRYSCETNENEGVQLRMMTLGALHNIINSNGKIKNYSLNINLIYCHLEKIAELILKEDLFKIFLLYIPYLSEPKIILFLFSICSNLIDYDTSMNSNQFFVFTRVNTDFRSV